MSNWDEKFQSMRLTPDFGVDLEKAKLKKEEAKRAPRTFVEDPYDVTVQLGYKDRRYSPTFDILKRIPQQLGIVSAILQTRISQIATFAQPHRENQGIGYRITHKDKHRETSRGENEFIRSMEKFIGNCGHPKHNKYSDVERDNFESFLKKSVRDSLIFDQFCFEVVPDRKGNIYEFMAVDASSIRIYAPSVDDHNPKGKGMASTFLDPNSQRSGKAYTTLDPNAPFEKRPAYVQLIDGKVVNVYSREEMAFCIRNPRTDLKVQGYGYSELEMLINTITNHLNAETYNSVFFKQGSQPKGILNFKGDSMSPEHLEAFKRMWRDQMEGVINFWRTPITQSEAGLEWLNLHTNNRDMEYGQWLEYLTKITCGVYLIDPSEINFDLHGGVQQTPLFESSQEWKLKASRDKGLRPLLRYFAEAINKNIVQRIDDDYVFEFVGLDEPTEKEKHDLRKEQSATYMTLNEVRRMDDRPDLPFGDVPMNPVYIQLMTLMQQNQQAEAQAGQPQPGGQPTQTPQSAGPGDAPDDTNDHVPEYTDSFGAN